MVKQEWDYSYQAKYYRYRPNYDTSAIRYICTDLDMPATVADIGAGTGNLTLILGNYLDSIDQIHAIEPNKDMMRIGKRATRKWDNISWTNASAERLPLATASYDAVFFGSSFNTTNRKKALDEAARILKPNGKLVILWNHRDLNSMDMRIVENIIKKHNPHYGKGTRRQSQHKILESHEDFKDILYQEYDQYVTVSRNDFIKGWYSVSGKGWTIQVANRIDAAIFKQFPKSHKFKIRYVTKVYRCVRK